MTDHTQRLVRVLLVDDDRRVAQVVSRMLAAAAFDVAWHESGESALEAFAADPDGFSVAVVDLQLPNLTGVGVARGLWEVRPGLPVLLVSGDLTDVERHRLPGPYRTLGKPIAMQALIQAVGESVRS